MQVILQVTSGAARSLNQRSPPTLDSEVLLEMIEAFGLTLEPMHRDVLDSNLQRYFTLEVPDHEIGQRVIDRLLQSNVVEAAYVKPFDELP